MQAAVTKMSVLRDHGSFGGGVPASESPSSEVFPQCAGFPKFAERIDEGVWGSRGGCAGMVDVPSAGVS
jgi:hypothetical protein